MVFATRMPSATACNPQAISTTFRLTCPWFEITETVTGTLSYNLVEAIRCTLATYSKSFDWTEHNGLCLDPGILLEPANIGHSALLLLGLTNALRLGLFQTDRYILDIVEGVANGIMSMQRSDGAFFIQFEEKKSVKTGIEFFPGEAMLSLMHTFCYFESSTSARENNDRILAVMEQAFCFYSDYKDTVDVDLNYNIWQVMAFAKYHDILSENHPQKRNVGDYFMGLCREICESRSWKSYLARGIQTFRGIPCRCQVSNRMMNMFQVASVGEAMVVKLVGHWIDHTLPEKSNHSHQY